MVTPLPSATRSGLIRQSADGPAVLNMYTPLPCAEIYGFVRPSAVGADELKLDLSSWLITEPTAKIPAASAGAVIVSQLPLPSFPALLTTKMPFWAAITAPWVMIA